MDALVVVDVEDRIRVRLARGFEGDLHEARAEDVREDGGADRAVLVEHLVDDVPGADLAGVAAREVLDVVLDDGRERGPVVDLRDPAGELRVPDWAVWMQRVSAVSRAGRDESAEGVPRVWARTSMPFWVA